MSDNDMGLHDELHELADAIAPATASTARDRARRTIARRARNRRAAVSGAALTVAAVVGATVFLAVDNDTKDSQRPAGTTTPRVTAPTTTAEPTTSTAPTPTTAPGSPITSALPALSEISAATGGYTKTFPWGTGDDQVAFHTPQGEGASGGPLAFEVDGRKENIRLFDHSNSRIVRVSHGALPAIQIATSPAVTAAAFDSHGRLIVATVGDLAVFAEDGTRLGNWPGMSLDAITALEVEGKFVYSVAENRTRTLLLRDEGDGYLDTRDAEPEPPNIAVDLNRETQILTMTVANGRQYRITDAAGVDAIRAVKLLPDGSLAFVLATQHYNNIGPDRVDTYFVGHIDLDGSAQYKTVAASQGYLLNGPAFTINDDAFGVMGSTTTGGVTVSYYLR